MKKKCKFESCCKQLQKESTMFSNFQEDFAPIYPKNTQIWGMQLPLHTSSLLFLNMTQLLLPISPCSNEAVDLNKDLCTDSQD